MSLKLIAIFCLKVCKSYRSFYIYYMALLDVLNGNYSLEAFNSKDSIISLLNERIDNAKKHSSWLSFDPINYKKFVLEGDTVTINRIPTMFAPYRGYGTIKIKFRADKNRTLINAIMIPYGNIKEVVFGFCLIFLVLFSVFTWLTTYGSSRYTLIAFAWIGLLGFQFLGITYYKYSLKAYFKKVLEDLSIKEI